MQLSSSREPGRMVWPERGSGLRIRPVSTGPRREDSMADEAAAAYGGLIHLAFFYRDQAEYLACLHAFIHDGQAGTEPAFVAVPGDKAWLVRSQLGREPPQVSYGDMAELGRNPGRIIPALRAFADAHPGRRVRYICEPVWPGRSAAETCEAAKHDALINVAF